MREWPSSGHVPRSRTVRLRLCERPCLRPELLWRTEAARFPSARFLSHLLASPLSPSHLLHPPFPHLVLTLPCFPSSPGPFASARGTDAFWADSWHTTRAFGCRGPRIASPSLRLYILRRGARLAGPGVPSLPGKSFWKAGLSKEPGVDGPILVALYNAHAALRLAGLSLHLEVKSQHRVSSPVGSSPSSSSSSLVEICCLRLAPVKGLQSSSQARSGARSSARGLPMATDPPRSGIRPALLQQGWPRAPAALGEPSGEEAETGPVFLLICVYH